MLLKDIYRKIKFTLNADRIGPDIPFTHWKLHFHSKMYQLCKSKFKYFDESADFRPGAYAVHCSNISIGKNVVVRPETKFFADAYAEIFIENNVMMGTGVQFYVNNHAFNRRDIPLIDQGYSPSKDIVIKNGAWLGANVIVLPGVTIGVNCVVGAGSVVTKSMPDYAICGGVPARIIKYIPTDKN